MAMWDGDTAHKFAVFDAAASIFSVPADFSSRATNDENRGAIVMDGSLVSSQSSVGLPAAAATLLGGRRSKSAFWVTFIARKQRRPGPGSADCSGSG